MPQSTEHIAVNELLGKPPGWLLRSGISLIFIVVIGGLLLAGFIHYPDELVGRALIEREQPPIAINPTVTAHLDTLLVEEGDTVQAQQLLGVLASDADWSEVMELASWLDDNAATLPVEPPSRFQRMGRLQTIYANWLIAAAAHNYYRKTDDLPQQLQSIKTEMAATRTLIQTLEDQLALLDKQIALERHDYERQMQLAEDGVISTQALEVKEKAWLAMRERRVSLTSGLAQHQLRISQLKQQGRDQARDQGINLFELARSYEQATQDLRGQIRAWQDQYLLYAPATGQVHLTPGIIEKQLVNAGTTLAMLQPLQAATTPLLAKMVIPANGLGKIQVGDKIIIRLDAFPEKEFGTLTTNLDRIAALPQVSEEETNEAEYYAEARLQVPLITSYNKTIPLQIQLSGTGTIITKDRSVLARIFEQLLSLVQQA